jgi:emfourin
MKITLATHGGQIAAMRLGRAPRVLNADSLTAAQKDELARLVAAAKRETETTQTREPRGADLMTYVVSAEDEKGTVTLKQSDSEMSPAFSALLDWLESHLPAK